jgi:hypothetical protein
MDTSRLLGVYRHGGVGTEQRNTVAEKYRTR